MSDAKQIKQLLLERVADLAPHLFPNGKKEGNHWHVGSIEGEAGKSFDVCIAGQKAGLYGDFEKSEKHSNNLLDLWMQARNVDFKTALREAAEWLGLPQTKSKRTFPTLEDAIHAVRPPKMLVTRRDTYRDANGIVRLVVVRFDGKEGKEFRPFHQTPEGWVIADPPGKLPLLDLPELVRHDLNRESSSEPVFVPEGEKCVRELRDKLGLLATTSAHGAKAPYKTDWTPLAGRPVVFLPDNDQGGQGYARSAAQILMQLSPQAKVKIVELPGLPEKGDCVDWIEARNGKPPEQIKAELLELAKNAEEIRQVEVEPVLLPRPPYVAPPLDLFPHEMQRFILAGAETFDVDRASFVLPVLSGAAATIGDARSIRLKEDYIEPPIIWSACIAPTGDAKSPVTQAATAPLRKREDQFMRLNKENAEEFARELAAWEATPKKERGKKPEKPPRLTCLMDDATIEAVALRLNDNPRGAALVKDELSHWFESFDQYHDRGGADVSRWLSIWNGFFFALDRVTEGRSYRIKNPRLSITSNVVPEVFKRLLTDDYFERGLPARFLFAMPPRNQPRKWIDKSIPAEIKKEMHELFDNLAALRGEYDKHHEERLRPILLGLSAEAEKVFEAFYNECARRAFEANPREAAQWSKLSAYSARLALVGQLMWDPKTREISGNVMQAACDLARWFGFEAERIYALIGETDTQRDRRKLIEFIQHRGGEVTEKDIYNNYRALKNKAKETTAWLEQLVRESLGKWNPIPPTEKGGRPTRKFCLFRPPPSA